MVTALSCITGAQLQASVQIDYSTTYSAIIDVITLSEDPGCYTLHGRTKNCNCPAFSIFILKRRRWKFILLHPGLDNEQREASARRPVRSASDEVQRIFAIDLASWFENRLRLFKFQLTLVRILGNHTGLVFYAGYLLLVLGLNFPMCSWYGRQHYPLSCFSTLCNLHPWSV